MELEFHIWHSSTLRRMLMLRPPYLPALPPLSCRANEAHEPQVGQWRNGSEAHVLLQHQ